MHRFELLARKYNASIREGDIVNDISMTRFPARAGRPARVVITYDRSLSRRHQILGVALMFGVLECNWETKFELFRFPMLTEDRQVWKEARRQYRDYRKPLERAADILITDHMIHQMKLGRREWWMLFEDDDIHPLAIETRRAQLQGFSVYMVPEPHPLFASNQFDEPVWCDGDDGFFWP